MKVGSWKVLPLVIYYPLNKVYFQQWVSKFAVKFQISKFEFKFYTNTKVLWHLLTIIEIRNY